MGAGRRQVTWSQRSRDALDEAVAYIRQDSADAARRLLQRVIETAAGLDRLSERGRIVPELEDPSLRELLVQPYRLIYEVQLAGARAARVHARPGGVATAKERTSVCSRWVARS